MYLANRFDGYRMYFKKLLRSRSLQVQDRLLLEEAVVFAKEKYIEIKPKENVVKYSATEIKDENNEITNTKKYIEELNEIEESINETFSQAVQAIARKKSLSFVDIYKRVGIDRRIFSKLKKNDRYQPSRGTAILIAIGLRLNVTETNELIMRAGYSLSHSRIEDLIVEFFIERKIYDLYLINLVLYEKTGYILKC